MIRFIYFSLLCVMMTTQVYAQKLRRQGDWGIYVTQLADSAQQQLTPEQRGPLIQWIHPDRTEAKIGLQAGDILLKIGEHRIKTPEDLYFSGILNTYRQNDFITYTLLRDGKETKLRGKVKPKPYEIYPEAGVLYEKVSFMDGDLRTITIHPEFNKAYPSEPNPRLPAIYFIPGYNCASYDNMNNIHPYKRLIDSLVGLGYVVFRCEKPGMGDCTNTPNCFDIDFHTEQQAFEAGYQKLMAYDFVDTNRIYIFGHSLGGINAPLLAEKYDPKGVIVYGTSHLPWLEYLQNMIRFQNPHLGVDPKTMAHDEPLYQQLFHDFFIDGLSPKELVAKNSEYLPLLQRDFQYTGNNMLIQRHYTFLKQLNELNLTEVWTNVKSHVLSIYGEADFEAINSESHEEIIRIVNHYHPDYGTFHLLPETNHSMLKVGSMQEGIDIYINGKTRKYMETSFNYHLITVVDDWIKAVEAKNN